MNEKEKEKKNLKKGEERKKEGKKRKQGRNKKGNGRGRGGTGKQGNREEKKRKQKKRDEFLVPLVDLHPLVRMYLAFQEDDGRQWRKMWSVWRPMSCFVKLPGLAGAPAVNISQFGERCRWNILAWSLL